MSAGKAALRAAFFICATTVALLIPFPHVTLVDLRPALFHGLEDLSHPAVFATLAYLIATALHARCGASTFRDGLLLLASLIGFGGLSEMLQHFTGRDASLHDFVADALGSWVGVALFHLAKGCTAHTWKRRALTASLVVSAVLAALPFAWTVSAYVYRHLESPVIWRAGSSLLDKFAYEHHGDYPGLELTELPPDWRGIRELLITVRNPASETATFSVRANDIEHNQTYPDRYNGDFTIAPATTQTYRISLQEIINAPVTRKMDVSRMSRLIVFERRANLAYGIDVQEIALTD